MREQPRAGVASRRNAEKLIAEGRVALDGEVITSPETKVAPGQTLFTLVDLGELELAAAIPARPASSMRSCRRRKCLTCG